MLAETLNNIVKTHADVTLQNNSWTDTKNGETIKGWACDIDLAPQDIIAATGDTSPTSANTQGIHTSAFGETLETAVTRASEAYFAARAASESNV